MKSVFGILPAAGLLVALGLAGLPASAQQKQAAPALKNVLQPLWTPLAKF